MHAYECALTVVALCACVGGHGAVAGVVLPLLDADAHVCTGVLLTCGTRTCRRANVSLSYRLALDVAKETFSAAVV